MSVRPILPIQGVPDELIRALNERFRELEAEAAPAAGAPAPPAANPPPRVVVVDDPRFVTWANDVSANGKTLSALGKLHVATNENLAFADGGGGALKLSFVNDALAANTPGWIACSTFQFSTGGKYTTMDAGANWVFPAGLTVTGAAAAASYSVGATAGVSGTFKSGDPVPKTITVTNGIITGIV